MSIPTAADRLADAIERFLEANSKTANHIYGAVDDYWRSIRNLRSVLKEYKQE